MLKTENVSIQCRTHHSKRKFLKKLFLWDCLIFVQYEHYRILGGSRHDTLRYFPAATYMMNIHRFRAVSYLLFATPTRITCVCQMQISLFMESAPQHVHSISIIYLSI